jgi:3-isopropylmalate dehydrogenase
MVQGGMGIAAGANINPDGVSMFEPIGGSAPKYTGQQKINPIAAILAAQLMLEAIGENKAASFIEVAVAKVLRENIKDVAAGKMGHTTQEVGDLIVAYIEENC